MEKRKTVAQQIKAQANILAEKLRADHVVIIAFYREGERYMHMQDDGNPPMPFQQLYEKLAQAHRAINEGQEGFISH